MDVARLDAPAISNAWDIAVDIITAAGAKGCVTRRTSQRLQGCRILVRLMPSSRQPRCRSRSRWPRGGCSKAASACCNPINKCCSVSRRGKDRAISFKEHPLYQGARTHASAVRSAFSLSISSALRGAVTTTASIRRLNSSGRFARKTMRRAKTTQADLQAVCFFWPPPS